MHIFSILFGAALLGAPIVQASALVERAVVDGPCTGAGGAPGSCISTAKCSAGGGTSITGACPGTPADIRCCTKTSCGSGGNCRWTSQCSGNTLSGLCPGPADFKCCVPRTGGGYPTPAFPAVGACKARAVDGAKKIVAGNPGKVREIYCTRACACPGTSDHCCGLANDLMCSSAGGVRTESGAPIAEWVMNNRASLGLKYVIWGQKIWNPSQDAVKPWSQWRGMEDRGSITANHWDHVHVSYNA
ncbi:hypothetical protein W97_05619 [Coniosporium apollinis CBS 100218]|uniref:ARB-07466-like C-terminal domain-containing protein n=1 Tax=Coniosporium apollinis (strain CBS 100218) TaxID=1168221 RepID=R7YX43_CONA1|nr:uncharacterized protein W97_05619 [Coniosporium apollinis CBS 100218]EON66226.1 hypothetical protein W97_05619 [Coniosporium apollinis CBS 100218]